MTLTTTRHHTKPYAADAARRLIVPRLNAAPMVGEIDYDDLDVVREWREYEVNTAGDVRYFMYELIHRDVGQERPVRYYKAARFIRVTRVPRYLRQTGKDPQAIFDQQRDVLAALRQEDVLFVNLIAKAPALPLIFAYGVQAVGSTPEEARALADRSYSVLAGQLDGTYQQLEYQPFRTDEAEALVRYRSEWNHLAVARGRPKPTGGSMSMGGLLDGNRTDVESAANQLESFLRGMGDQSFLLSLISVPVAPLEITRAWRNLANKLSDIRSDTDGVRAVNAGIGIPMGLGHGLGESVNQSHSAGESAGEGFTVGESVSHTDGVNFSESVSQTSGVTVGQSQAESFGVTDTFAISQGVTEGVSQGLSASESLSQSASVSENFGVSQSHSLADSITQGQTLSEATGVSHSESVGQSISQGQSLSESASFGESVSHSAGLSQSFGESVGASLSQGRGISLGESISLGETSGVNWGAGANQSLAAGITNTSTIGQSLSETLQQAFGITDTDIDNSGDGESSSRTTSGGGSFGGRIGGFNLGSSITEGTSFNRGLGDSDSISSTLTTGGSFGSSLSEAIGKAFTETTGISETVGGSTSQSTTAGQSVGQSEQVTAGQSISATQTTGASESISAGQTASRGFGMVESVTAGQSIAQSQGLSRSVGMSESLAAGRSVGVTDGVSVGAGTGRSVGAGQTVGQTASQSQAVSQSTSQAQATSQSVSRASSLSESLSATAGRSAGVSASDTVGSSVSASQSRGLSDAYLVGMGRNAQASGTFGLVPTVGISISRQTRDEAKRIVGDILEAQMRRYLEGVESGAFFYQMFLQADNPETLARASGLLKSAFWGPGDNARLPQPFHVISYNELDTEEVGRLLEHARALSSYRRREPDAEFIEPYVYSTYITPGEMAAFTHPPTAEGLGLLAVHDSMPVFAMPYDRAKRDMHLGYIVNGERAKVTDVHYGIDLKEINHTLVAGITGSGKTTSVLKLLTEAVQTTRTVTTRLNPADPTSPHITREVPAGALCLDWQRNMRSLANVVEPDRFKLFSMSKPALGEFRWNLLAVPTAEMSPVEWANTIADQFMISYGLGEYARSIIWEHIDELYSANRLEPYELMPPQIDEAGVMTRPGVVLPPIDRSTLPPEAIQVNQNGDEYANVYSWPELSRLIGVGELALSISGRIEALGTQEAGRMFGTEIRNRYQTIWRRLQYFAPGGPFARMFSCDPSLAEKVCLTVDDLVDPDRGLVTVIEADGLDVANRRLVLGTILMSVWRYGQTKGEGTFNLDGEGPGTFVVLEEAHELFGSQGDGEDHATAQARTTIYESMFRRARALGMKLVAVCQNVGDIPAGIYSNTGTVILHRLYDRKDREVASALLNWDQQLDHRRERRYLGELPLGWAIVRLEPQSHYLEAAPVHIVVDPSDIAPISDLELLEMAEAPKAGASA